MHYLKNSLLALLLCSLTLLTACGEDNSKKITSVDNPELVAIAFFDALYNEKNVEKAASVCNPKLARLILHYRSPGAVARHLFNMSYDKVEIKPDSAGVKVREQFKDNANITIYFDGYYQNNRMKDVKRLAFIQRDGKWFIDKVLKDPF
ncbi:MAG TPA: hypothetical protein DEO86_20800 [Colwellia sp.]|jgi:hypothetical protein|nr:hypothetical protein [Colwellia sp.]|tara:strand:+ start:191 stop:637 length:447 start_codon:yes stop_codon:yes gene_type:complete